jgi:hypothetical protein
MLTGDLGRIISTRNGELVELAIDAYYKTNTFQAWILNKREGLSGNIRIVTMTYPPTVHGTKIRHLEIVSLECVTGYALPDMLLPFNPAGVSFSILRQHTSPTRPPRMMRTCFLTRPRALVHARASQPTDLEAGLGHPGSD